MTTLNAHFEGKQLVLDDPVPDDLPANAKASVTVHAEPENALDKIAAMARPLGLPRDFAMNHKHYVKGAPKR